MNKQSNRKLFEDTKVVICSDSTYAMNACTVWFKTWEANGYKTSSGGKVKNLALITSIVNILKSEKGNGRLDFLHVASHKVAPLQRDSLEYYLWEGNFNVDKMINDEISLQFSKKS